MQEIPNDKKYTVYAGFKTKLGIILVGYFLFDQIIIAILNCIDDYYIEYGEPGMQLYICIGIDTFFLYHVGVNVKDHWHHCTYMYLSLIHI